MSEETKKVNARFIVDHVTKTRQGMETVSLVPVTRHDTKDNIDWSKYTPSGNLTMAITAEGAQGVFKPGKVYAVTLEETE